MALDIYKWLVVVAGISILLTIAGLPTGAGLILDRAGINLVDNPSNISLSPLVIAIAALFAAAAVTGIVVGFFTKSSPIEFLLATTYMGILLVFVGDTIAITNYAMGISSWGGWIVLMVMVPISIGYLHSLVSWWAGRS